VWDERSLVSASDETRDSLFGSDGIDELDPAVGLREEVKGNIAEADREIEAIG
jgi:hypothetical protein